MAVGYIPNDIAVFEPMPEMLALYRLEENADLIPYMREHIKRNPINPEYDQFYDGHIMTLLDNDEVGCDWMSRRYVATLMALGEQLE